MNITYVGIDPGFGGAVAWLIDGELSIKALPAVKHGKGGKRYDQRLMFHVFAVLPKPLYVMLEEPHIHGHDSRQNIAINNRGFGQIEMALTCVGDCDVTIVPSHEWQKVMHMGHYHSLHTDPKDRSIAACRKLFPSVSLIRTCRSTKPNDGFADAALLAKYAEMIQTRKA